MPPKGIDQTETMSVMRISDLADILDVGVATIRRWSAEGHLATLTTPTGRILVRVSDIRELLEHGPLLKPGTVAYQSGVTTQTVRAWISSGLIPHVVLPSGRVRVPMSWSLTAEGASSVGAN
jgi:predicted site-specific integrase-resolvase